MFKTTPKVLAHRACTINGNFVTTEYILNKNTDTSVNLWHRYCPHRQYPLHTPGETIQDVWCKFHNFKWDANGIPINNDKKISCGSADVGKSGLVFKDWCEPDHSWVTDLQQETRLEYSHSVTGSSNGSWLWLTDAEADLLHVYAQGIHPFLSQQINLDQVQLENGDDWVIQTHPDGWWLYVFPFTFVEYGRPGKLMVNTVTPKNNNSEFGFEWIIQFYYAPDVSVDDKFLFETLEAVFREDVTAAEQQKGPYYPLMEAMNRYEEHSVQFGKWYRKHIEK